jgi:hypothetical protein
MKKLAAVDWISGRATTLSQLVQYFSSGVRLFMLPLLILVLTSGLVLLVVGGLSYVAPFVYITW